MARLKPGDKMPDFTFSTAYAEGRTVKSAMNGKPAFFMVLRYIGCTVCRYDVHLLSKRYGEFLEKGAQVFVVMQSDPEVVREEMKEHALPFDVICDPGLAIYKALDIAPAKDMGALVPDDARAALQAKVAAAKSEGFSHGKYEGIEEQLPALFLVDGSGIVQYAHYGENLMDMPNIDGMLAML